MMRPLNNMFDTLRSVNCQIKIYVLLALKQLNVF